jgi:hypothetical protein
LPRPSKKPTTEGRGASPDRSRLVRRIEAEKKEKSASAETPLSEGRRMKNPAIFSPRQKWTALSLALVVPAGFYSKFHTGPGAAWVNNSLGGALYEVFWCLLAALVFPKAKPLVVAAAVFTATCILEGLQLWHPPFLQYPRSFFLGRVLLGTTFVPTDFFYYLLGSAAGWLWLKALERKPANVGGTAPARAQR